MPMEPVAQFKIELQDTQWPLTYTDHDREIVRAIVVDDANSYYFVRALRNDDFGAASLIETSGGGVEPGEDLESAIHRELREELGAQVEILAGIGVVSDYYNLIHRHNINHYYLCRVKSFGNRCLTQDEIDRLNKLIKKTEAAAWKEQQPKKRFELYSKLKDYQKQLEEITHGET